MISYKLPLAALGAAFFFAFGWWARPNPPPEVVAQTQVAQDVQVKTVDRVVTKIVTVKERAPDGTTKQTRTKEVAEVADSTQRREVRAAETVARVPTNTPSTWSVGAEWAPRLSPDVYKPVSAEVGYRVGGPVWVTGSWNWQQHAALAGIRIEF